MRYPEFWIRKIRGLDLAERAILDRLVLHAGKDDTGRWAAWPAIKTLNLELEISRRYTERTLDEIEAKEFISREKQFRGHKQQTNKYFLNVDRLHPRCAKSDHYLSAIKMFVRDLMTEEKFNNSWNEINQSWYQEKRHLFYIWVDSKKLQNKIEKNVPEVNDFLRKKFGTIARKLPRNAKRAKPEIPVMRIQLVEFYLKKSD